MFESKMEKNSVRDNVVFLSFFFLVRNSVNMFDFHQIVRDCVLWMKIQFIQLDIISIFMMNIVWTKCIVVCCCGENSLIK